MESDYAISLGRSKQGREYWTVGFSRRGVPHVKRFYFGAKRSSEQARALAEAWREARLREAEPMTIAEFAALQRSNNTSGEPGVTFHVGVRGPLGFWQARLILGDGWRMVKSFSVQRHGYGGAFQKAVEARRRMLATVADRPLLYDPTAKRLAPRPGLQGHTDPAGEPGCAAALV